MAAFKPGGYGHEAYGDPMSGGGPLHVVRARAVKSHVVRVAFNEEPLHRSFSGRFDALNPANYAISLVSGQVVDPFFGLAGFVQAIGVDRDPILPPAAGVNLAPFVSITGASNATPVVVTTATAHGMATGDRVHVEGVLGNTGTNGDFKITFVSATTFALDGSVGNGVYVASSGRAFPAFERGFDVHTDKALVIGVTYRITASNVKSKFGGVLGAPFAADFPGILPRPSVRPLRQPVGFRDIRNDVASGAFVVDDSGDLAVEDGLASLRKRIFRRLTTSKNAFSFLPGYGVGLRIKELASVGQLAGLKSDITQQIGREPEVQSVDSTLSLRAEGVLTVTLRVQTKAGAVVDLQMARTSDGRTVVL